MTTTSLTVHGIFSLRAPTHISAPENYHAEIVEGYVRAKPGKTPQGKEAMACTATQHREFLTAANAERFPFIAANNVAGRMRREAASLVMEALRKKNQKISLGSYSILTCGAASSSPDMEDVSYAEYKRAMNHPYLGLVGGGPKMIKRNMQVFDVLPCNEFLRDQQFSIAHPHEENCRLAKNGYELTAVACFKRGDDIRSMLNVDQMEAMIENFDDEMRDRAEEMLKDKKGKEEGLKNTVRSSTVTWSSFEFIKPGADFDFTIKLNKNTDAQIGLFLLSLENFAQKHIGGQARNGLGRFTLNDVMLVGSGIEIKDVFNNNKLVKTHPSIEKYLKAWDAAAAAMTSEELEEILKHESKEEKQAKNAEKQAKLDAIKATRAAEKAAAAQAKA